MKTLRCKREFICPPSLLYMYIASLVSSFTLLAFCILIWAQAGVVTRNETLASDPAQINEVFYPSEAVNCYQTGMRSVKE